jgi:hypothetical protein
VTATATAYYYEFYTAVVGGTPYPGENPMVYSQTITIPDTIYTQITFPALTVTDLTPGEAITMVCSILRLLESHFQS